MLVIIDSFKIIFRLENNQIFFVLLVKILSHPGLNLGFFEDVFCLIQRAASALWETQIFNPEWVEAITKNQNVV